MPTPVSKQVVGSVQRHRPRDRSRLRRPWREGRVRGTRPAGHGHTLVEEIRAAGGMAVAARHAPLGRLDLAAVVARAGWASVLLLAPERVLGIGGRPSAPPAAAVAVARVLGARQLAQVVVTAARPSGPVAGTGAAVDAIPAGTDMGLAATSARWRRIALIDAIIAAVLAASGWRSARKARRWQG